MENRTIQARNKQGRRNIGDRPRGTTREKHPARTKSTSRARNALKQNGGTPEISRKRKGARATGGIPTFADDSAEPQIRKQKGGGETQRARRESIDRRTRNIGAAGQQEEEANPNICRRTRWAAGPTRRVGNTAKRLGACQETPQEFRRWEGATPDRGQKEKATRPVAEVERRGGGTAPQGREQ